MIRFRNFEYRESAQFYFLQEEFACNVCGLGGANSTEIDQKCAEPVIDIPPEQKKIEGLGGRDVELKKDTQAWELFNQADSVRMRLILARE